MAFSSSKALTSAALLVPAALATGIDSDVQRPLATVLVGGLLSTLLLTLLALPSLYYLVVRRHKEATGM